MSAWLNTAAAVVVVAFASAVMVSAAPPPATSAPGLSPAHVLVINGAAQPVPVAPQGTTIVGGSVAATQSGTWNVGVAGTADVRVTNASPLPVTLQGGEAAAQLVMNAAAASFTSGESTVVLYRVPAGKRLIVDQVGISSHVVAGTVRAAICREGFIYCLPIVVQNQGVFGGNVQFAGTERVTYFAEAGEQMFGVCANSTGSSGDYCSATFVGRLVDGP